MPPTSSSPIITSSRRGRTRRPGATPCWSGRWRVRSARASDPLLVRGWTVDRRDFPAGHAQVDRELAAMVDLIEEQEPEEIHARHGAHGLRGGEEMDFLDEKRVRGRLDQPAE